MYGSIARWRVKDGKGAELEQLAEEVMARTPAGSQSVMVYRADADANEYWVASVWDSKDAYFANSNTPEQDTTFRKLRELMDVDPEWHDGEIVISRS
jgi:heme-degrading monooxygenase HmoA